MEKTTARGRRRRSSGELAAERARLLSAHVGRPEGLGLVGVAGRLDDDSRAADGVLGVDGLIVGRKPPESVQSS